MEESRVVKDEFSLSFPAQSVELMFLSFLNESSFCVLFLWEDYQRQFPPFRAGCLSFPPTPKITIDSCLNIRDQSSETLLHHLDYDSGLLTQLPAVILASTDHQPADLFQI